MPAKEKAVRQSVTLPPNIATKIRSIAKRRRLSANRVLVELIEEGIEAQKQKEKAFFELAKEFRAASDPKDIERLGDELGQMVFIKEIANDTGLDEREVKLAIESGAAAAPAAPTETKPAAVYRADPKTSGHQTARRLLEGSVLAINWPIPRCV